MNARLFSITFLIGGLALTLLATVCALLKSQSTARVISEKQQTELHDVSDANEPLHLVKADLDAMVCTKCKTILFYRVPPPFTSAWYFARRERIRNEWAGENNRQAFRDWYRHFCPGCESTIMTTSTLLNRKETVKHT